MSIEIIIGGLVIIGVAIWAGIYISRRNKENNNEHLFDFIPHLFPTLGILFTFLGIAIGLWNFDSNDIEKSIPELMNGLKSAFLVSILGVGLLVAFSIWTNIKRKNLEEGVLSQETIAIQRLTEVILELKNDLTSTDKEGNVVKAGNVWRDMYEESRKQSNSLQTFSTDLALTISEGFQQILNNPNEGVVAELKLLRVEIENLGNKMKDPATDMTQSIVKDLQGSMGKMMEEFKTSMSGDTKNELERLASLLGNAGGTLADFPIVMQEMTNRLNENFLGLQNIVQGISQQTLQQSEQSTIEMRRQVEEMSEILRSKVGDLQVGQESLLNTQSKNLQLSDKLFSSFNASVERMNDISNTVMEAMAQFNLAQAELERVTASLRNISQNVNTSSSKFGESQVNFARYSNEFLKNNSSTIGEIQKSLSTAQIVSADYALKFEIIEKGLQGVFTNINQGLKDYQTTVGQSLESFLARYTEHLTKTAEALASASSKQEDILEELTEQLSKLNLKRG